MHIVKHEQNSNFADKISLRFSMQIFSCFCSIVIGYKIYNCNRTKLYTLTKWQKVKACFLGINSHLSIHIRLIKLTKRNDMVSYEKTSTGLYRLYG